MLNTSNNHIELLRTAVLLQAGLKTINPSDCKFLAALVAKETKQILSETTFKRIYGFALSKFEASLFTKNILSQFCGYDSWDSFRSTHAISSTTNKTVGTDWINLKEQAARVTDFTLQALKHRSGIPFQQTISRKALTDHLMMFDESEATATIIASPTGYGKTTALCHWAQGMENTGDILLMFSGTALMSTMQSGKDIHKWIDGFLALNAIKELENLTNGQTETLGKFYLVIDGFDEANFKKDQFKLILNKLLDICSIYQQYDWFKMILCMRPETWTNCRIELESAGHKWFTGFSDNFPFNFPHFNSAEVYQLAKILNPSENISLSKEQLEMLLHPLRFQYYYKQYREWFSLSFIDRTTLFELNAAYILHKVYLGQNAAEKVLLMKGLVAAIELNDQRYIIDKLKVNYVLKLYAAAYQELIAGGLLLECNESAAYRFKSVIKFNCRKFLTYNLAQSLLEGNDGIFDEELINRINIMLDGHEIKLDVLKWCIIDALKTNQQAGFNALTGITLTQNAKIDLVLFLGDVFEKELFKENNTTFANYDKQHLSDRLFDYFFGMELINNEYKQVLETLLKFDLGSDKKIITFTCLGIISLIQLDLPALDENIAALKNLPSSNINCLAVNPILCLESMSSFLRYGKVEKGALVSLTGLLFNHPEDLKNLKNCASNDVLYILGLYTLASCSPRKVLRMSDALSQFYKPLLKEHALSPYRFFIQMARADSFHKLQRTNELSAVYYEISATYLKSEQLLTPYMRTLFHCLKVKMLISTGREDEIVHEMKCIDVIVKDSGSRFSQLYTLNLLLKKQSLLDRHPNYRKQLSYEYKKMIRVSGLSEVLIDVA